VREESGVRQARDMGRRRNGTEDRLRSLLPLLDFFYRITGLTVSLCTEHDNELRRIFSTGAEFLPCTVVKADPELAARCDECDLHHLRIAHQRKRYLIYECHAGMVDIVAPILGLPIKAAALTGQILPRPPSAEERDRLVRHLETPHTSAARLRRAIAKTRFMPEERIEAAAKLLGELVQYGIGPSSSADLTPLKSYVASELLKRQEWRDLQGIARMVGVESPPRIVLAVQVVHPGWRESVDWRGLHRAREVVAEVAPSTLAVIERDKLIVLWSDLPQVESGVRRLLQALRATGLRVAIGVGRPCDAERPVWQSYHEAEMALGYRFLSDEPIVFLEQVERHGRRSDLIPSALQNLALIIRLGDGARAQQIVHTLVQELGREPYSAAWALDCGVEILSLMIHELREAGNKSDALPGILRHFLNSAERAASTQDILVLLEASAAHLIGHAKGAAHNTADLVERVCDHVQRHLAEPVSLERLCAEALFVSPDHFSRTFQRVKGIRFKQWVLQQRIEQAKQLLALTDETIASLAVRCGFDHHAYFCRAFRKVSGMTPTAYRQACRTEPGTSRLTGAQSLFHEGHDVAADHDASDRKSHTANHPHLT
jgi:AraC-like DNA-binding protein/ligand-binding sensor protein